MLIHIVSTLKQLISQKDISLQDFSGVWIDIECAELRPQKPISFPRRMLD